jgi:hypothetical protein
MPTYILRNLNCFWKVNLSIEICAGKLTMEDIPQRWNGVETKAENKSNFTFSFHPDKQPATKPKKFYGGDNLHEPGS